MFGIAALLLGLALKLPIWRIDIWAPQYPEGLSLQIFADRIGGNVSQINILNHYIGMKHIIPDQIPELTMIPWALGFVVLFGILVILSNRLIFAKVWLALLGVLSIVGLIDFYQWGYDYGHNLSPNAPIKIPGFSYQPPLFGYKKILNIEAYSLPDWGAMALLFGILLIFLGIYGKKILQLTASHRACIASRFAALFLLPLFLISCTVKPEPIKIGDLCDNCHMSVSDVRFGAEVITKKGRRLKFDSINCLQSYLSKNSDQAEKIFVSDYSHQGELINVNDAHFLSHSKISGPMGPDTIASKDESALEKIKSQVSGKVTNWKGLSQSSL
jgi:copper chaperone NosL